MLKVSNLVTTLPVPSYYQLNLEGKILMFAQGVEGTKTEVIQVGGVTLMHGLVGYLI